MVDWINISSNSGSGNATITVTATSYSQLLERSTTLTVRTATKSAVVGITQRFNSNFTVSPATISAIPYSGASYSITVTANANWSATTVPAWCSLSANGGASGTSIITLTVSSNSGSARNDTLVFTCNGIQRTVSVSQAADNTTPVEIAFIPSYINFPSSGSAESLSVVCDGEWTLTGPNWLTFSQASGSGNTTVTVTTSPNTGDPKSQTYITGSTINDTALCAVWQEGYYVNVSGEISPSTITVDANGGNVTVYITSSTSWRLSWTGDFISMDEYNRGVRYTSGMSGTSIPVVVWVDTNYSSARTATLTLTSTLNNSVLDTATLTQTTIPITPATIFTVGRFDWCGGETGATQTLAFSFTGNTTPAISRLDAQNTADANGQLTTRLEGNVIYITSTFLPGDIRMLYDAVYELNFNYQSVIWIFVASDTFSCCPKTSTFTIEYNVTTMQYAFGVPLFRINPAFVKTLVIDNNPVDFTDQNIEVWYHDGYAEVSYYFDDFDLGNHTVEAEFYKTLPIFTSEMPISSIRLVEDSLQYFQYGADFTNTVQPVYWEVKSNEMSGCNTIWQGATFEDGITNLAANLFADRNTFSYLSFIRFKGMTEPQLGGDLGIPEGSPYNRSKLYIPSGSNYTNVIRQLPRYWDVIYDA